MHTVVRSISNNLSHAGYRARRHAGAVGLGRAATGWLSRCQNCKTKTRRGQVRGLSNVRQYFGRYSCPQDTCRTPASATSRAGKLGIARRRFFANERFVCQCYFDRNGYAERFVKTRFTQTCPLLGSICLDIGSRRSPWCKGCATSCIHLPRPAWFRRNRFRTWQQALARVVGHLALHNAQTLALHEPMLFA